MHQDYCTDYSHTENVDGDSIGGESMRVRACVCA